MERIRSRTSTVTFRLKPKLKKRVEAIAREEGLSLSGFIVRTLVDEVRARKEGSMMLSERIEDLAVAIEEIGHDIDCQEDLDLVTGDPFRDAAAVLVDAATMVREAEEEAEARRAELELELGDSWDDDDDDDDDDDEWEDEDED